MSTLEQRVSDLENQVRGLADDRRAPAQVPWWERIYGTFADSEAYDDAMRLGREYRQSLRPRDDLDAAN